MESLTNNGIGHSTAKIFVIFRVFSIDKKNVGMRVYVDPWKLKKTGELHFTTDKWTVTPMHYVG